MLAVRLLRGVLASALAMPVTTLAVATFLLLKEGVGPDTYRNFGYFLLNYSYIYGLNATIVAVVFFAPMYVYLQKTRIGSAPVYLLATVVPIVVLAYLYGSPEFGFLPFIIYVVAASSAFWLSASSGTATSAREGG